MASTLWQFARHMDLPVLGLAYMASSHPVMVLCALFRLLLLCACTGFRERLLADPSFLMKVAIEVGIGICTKCTAEYTKRQGTFHKVRYNPSQLTLPARLLIVCFWSEVTKTTLMHV